MSSFRRLLSLQTPKYHFLQKAVGNRPFKLLDVGAGNHSPSKTTRLFPACEYYGLDLNKDYAYNEEDERALKDFYEKDLTELQLDDVPDSFFDFIMMAHIIEHLHNGDAVLRLLAKKLKPGGHIYIEYPGRRSTKLPSMPGTLNFYDDNTHVRVYSYQEVGAVLKESGCAVLSSGVRRSPVLLLATPIRALAAIVKGRKPQGNVFWDLLGFAEYVFAGKVKSK